MRSKIWTILTVLLVFSLLVAACGGADEPAPPPPNPQPPRLWKPPPQEPTRRSGPHGHPGSGPEAPAAAFPRLGR